MFEAFSTSYASPVQGTQIMRPQALGSDVDYFLDLKDPRLALFMREGTHSASGAFVTPNTAMRCAAVFACVRILSGAVATMPIDIKRRISDKVRADADGEPAWIMFKRRPNTWMRPAQLKRMLLAHVLLRGNAFCFRVKDSKKRTVSLLPLHPDRTNVKQLPNLSLEYTYNPPNGGGQRKFAQDDIFHLMGFTEDGVIGRSVLTYARETIGLSLATARHGADYFHNGTQVGSLLKHPGKLGPAAQDTLRGSLEKYRSGEANASKTLILEEGMTYEKLGMSAQDAQFVETMGLNRSEVAMFFGVPPHMIGDTEKSTSWGTGIESQTQGFVTFSLEDWITDFEEAITADLLDYDEKLYAKFQRSALVRSDFAARWAGYTKAAQFGILSPDEIRAKEDENPRTDGKGGEYYPPPNKSSTSPDSGEVKP